MRFNAWDSLSLAREKRMIASRLQGKLRGPIFFSPRLFCFKDNAYEGSMQ